MSSGIDRFLDALLVVRERLDPTDVVWALTGSLGHALQGVPVEVHDVDLQTDERGAYGIESSLRELVTRPVELSGTGTIRSHFGELAVGGVKVEIMGAVQTRRADGRWGRAVEVEAHRTWVTVRGRPVPVLTLAHEVGAYEALGRPERAALLRRFLPDPTEDPRTERGTP